MVLLWPDAITADDASELQSFLAARRPARRGRHPAGCLARACRARSARVVRRAPGRHATARAAPRDGRRAHARGRAAGPLRRRRLGAPGGRRRPRDAGRGRARSERAARSCWPIPRRCSTAARTARRCRVRPGAGRPGPPGRLPRERARLRARERLGRPARRASRARSCCLAWRARRSCWRAAGVSGRPSRQGGCSRRRAPPTPRGSQVRSLRSGPAGRCDRARGRGGAQPPARARGRRRRRVLAAARGVGSERGRGRGDRARHVEHASRARGRARVWHASTSGGESHDRGLRARARRGGTRRRGAGADRRPRAGRGLHGRARAARGRRPASPRRSP